MRTQFDKKFWNKEIRYIKLIHKILRLERNKNDKLKGLQILGMSLGDIQYWNLISIYNNKINKIEKKLRKIAKGLQSKEKEYLYNVAKDNVDSKQSIEIVFRSL